MMCPQKRQKRRIQEEAEAETGVTQPRKRRRTHSHQELEGPREDPPGAPGSQPHQHQDCSLLASVTETEYISVSLKPHHLWSFVMATMGSPCRTQCPAHCR